MPTRSRTPFPAPLLFVLGTIARVAATVVPAASLAAPSVPAYAGTVTVPIRLDEAFLRRLLIEQAFAGPAETAELWDDAHGCGHVALREPEVDGVAGADGGSDGGRLIVRAAGDARWGTSVGERCFVPLSWHGRIEIHETPQLDDELPIVHFRVVDTKIFGKSGRRTFLTSRLWDWIKAYVHPHMERVTVDLHRPVQEVRALLPLVLGAEYADDTDATLASVTLADARVEDGALVVELSLASPEWDDAQSPRPEPPLDVEEVESWDAFLTFVIKRAALDVPDARMRGALLTVLLESRYDIVEALLGAKGDPSAPDPVPELFRKAWQRLAPVLRGFDQELPGADALRYLSFIAAGDALVAIEELGPGSGLDISADGLRRLARIVAPDETRDPLEFAVTVDPELRERLGFGPPLPLPASPPTVQAPTTTVAPTTTTTAPAARDGGGEPPALYRSPPPPAASPPSTLTPSPTTTVPAPAPPAPLAPPTLPPSPDSPAAAPPLAPPAPSPPPTVVVPPPSTVLPPAPAPPSSPPSPQLGAPTTTLPRAHLDPPAREPPLVLLWRWLLRPARAEAAESTPRAHANDPIEALRARLESWAPARQDLDEYLPLVRDVLDHAARVTLDEKPVPAFAQPMFRPLVLATAWKETCWRQFVRRSGKVVPIESSAGAVGIMQVNPRVWRGFYDVAALRADLVYNAEAGSEIVQHYLVDYAIKKKEHEKGGGVDALVRATYAAYNGGPGHLSRYRAAKTPKSLRAIDAEFWRVYQRVKSGDELGVRSCWP